MFAKRTKTADLPSSILENLKVVQDPSAKEKKIASAREALDTQFLALKDSLYGLNEVSSDDVRIVRSEIVKSNFVKLVLNTFDTLDFHNRKHFANIMSCLLHKDAPDSMIQYLKSNADVVYQLLSGAGSPKHESQTVLLYLEMLKSCFQHRALAELVLPTDRFWVLFSLVGTEDFAVSASAFVVLKDMLLAFPDLLGKSVIGDRKRTDALLHQLAKLMLVGSASQKKKSIDMVAHLLHFAELEPLIQDVGLSVEIGQTLAKLILLKDQITAKAAVIVKGVCVLFRPPI
jgi:hypothetical protein